MLFYFVIFLFVAGTSFLDLTNIDRSNKLIILCLLGAVIVTIAGIRWETGADWTPYYNFFEYNERLTDFIEDPYQFEYGFGYLNYIVKNIFESYNVMLAIISCIVVVLKYTTLYQFSPYPLLAGVINFSNFNGDIFPVRQYIAIAICFFSIRYIIRKNKVFFIMAILIATLFHVTALVFLLAYYLYWAKISTRMWIILISCSIMCSIIGVMNDISIYLLQNTVGVDVAALAKLSEYSDPQSANNLIEETNYGNITYVIAIVRRMIILPILFYYKKHIICKYDIYEGFLNIYCFSVFLFIMFTGGLTLIAGRMTIYFFSIESLILACMLGVPAKMNNKLIVWLVLLLYCALKFYWGITMYPNAFIPFKTVL